MENQMRQLIGIIMLVLGFELGWLLIIGGGIAIFAHMIFF